MAPPLPLPAFPKRRSSPERERETLAATWNTGPGKPAGTSRWILPPPFTVVPAVMAIVMVIGMDTGNCPQLNVMVPPGGFSTAFLRAVSSQLAGVPVPTTALLAPAGRAERTAQTRAAVSTPAREVKARHGFIGLSFMR